MIQVLSRMGFVQAHQKGSHVFFKHSDGRATTIPVHKGEDLGRGLIRSILRDIELKPKEFLKILNK